MMDLDDHGHSSKLDSIISLNSPLMMTECVEKTVSEGKEFRKREQEFLSDRKKEIELMRASSEKFPRVKGPLKQLAEGSIAFTRDLVDTAKRFADIEITKQYMENIVTEIAQKAVDFSIAKKEAKKKKLKSDKKHKQPSKALKSPRHQKHL